MPGKKFRPYNTDNVSLSAQSALNTKGTAISFHDCHQVDWLVTTSAGVSDGTVRITCSDDPAYAGNWFVLGESDLATLGASGKDGSTYPDPPGAWVRAEISEAVVGGTVTVSLNGIQTVSR